MQSFRHYLDKNSYFKKKININYKVVKGNFDKELNEKGGLRCEILNDGEIKIDDIIKGKDD